MSVQNSRVNKPLMGREENDMMMNDSNTSKIKGVNRRKLKLSMKLETPKKSQVVIHKPKYNWFKKRGMKKPQPV